MKSFIICTLHQYYSRGSIEEGDERASKHAWKGLEVNKKYESKILKGRNYFVRPIFPNGDNIKMVLKGIGSEDVNLIKLAENRLQWRAVV